MFRCIGPTPFGHVFWVRRRRYHTRGVRVWDAAKTRAENEAAPPVRWQVERPRSSDAVDVVFVGPTEEACVAWLEAVAAGEVKP